MNVVYKVNDVLTEIVKIRIVYINKSLDSFEQKIKQLIKCLFYLTFPEEKT